jgi:hypothetical protein
MADIDNIRTDHATRFRVGEASKGPGPTPPETGFSFCSIFTMPAGGFFLRESSVSSIIRPGPLRSSNLGSPAISVQA